MSGLYKIIRFRRDGENDVVKHGLTLEEAQAHCRREDTHGEGWFDGYDDDDGGPLVVTRGPWKFVWSGGRLADVFHLEVDHAIDCVQVGHYDWKTGTSTAEFNQVALGMAADEWVQECSDDYRRELPYL